MGIAATLERPPVEIRLEDGTEVAIRPLRGDDKIALARFFQRVPEEDRFYLKENASAPEVIRDWTEHIDPDRAIPLVAVTDGRIIGDATLHRSRAPARRHVGELRVVVDPEYRGKGLGLRLVKELIDIGRALKLNRLFFELVDVREKGAIRVASAAGFGEVAVLRRRVKDIYGSFQDLLVLELVLEGEAAG